MRAKICQQYLLNEDKNSPNTLKYWKYILPKGVHISQLWSNLAMKLPTWQHWDRILLLAEEDVRHDVSGKWQERMISPFFIHPFPAASRLSQGDLLVGGRKERVFSVIAQDGKWTWKAGSHRHNCLFPLNQSLEHVHAQNIDAGSRNLGCGRR